MKPRADTKKRFPPKREDGTRQCVWCGKTRPDGAGWRTWCSDQCLEEYEILAMPSRVRVRVHMRDKGICAICGVDCDRLQRWIESLKRDPSMMFKTGKIDRFRAGHFGHWLGRHRSRALTLLGRLWGVSLSGRKTLWDADHIIPVAEGGGGCGLDNYRTLCRRCHKNETAALAARLARRPNKGVGRGF